MLLRQHRLGFFLTVFATCAFSSKLVWEDCGSEDSDAYELEVLDYEHTPDPLVAGASSIRSRSFRYIGNRTLLSLRESVAIQESFLDPSDPSFSGWEDIVPYFNNSFDVGESHDLVPIEPQSDFSYSDQHTPSSNPNTTWYRSVEKYYGSYDSNNSSDARAYIGCIVVTYQQVAAAASYTAAVAQLPGVGVADASTSDVISRGLEQYRAVANAAVIDARAQMVVFPEWGLMGEGAFGVQSRTAVTPFCEDLSSSPEGQITQGLSGLAKDLSIVVVANICEKMVCAEPTNTTACPFQDGLQLFNTEVAFDESGVLIAKYHKQHVWKRHVFDTPLILEVVTFTASFGVTFGLFVCFDIAFPHPQRNLLELGVRHFPYSVALSPLLDGRAKNATQLDEQELSARKQLLAHLQRPSTSASSFDFAHWDAPAAIFEAWSRRQENATLLASDLGVASSGIYFAGKQVGTAAKSDVVGFPDASYIAAEVPT